jgi:hypothetical protein
VAHAREVVGPLGKGLHAAAAKTSTDVDAGRLWPDRAIFRPFCRFFTLDSLLEK